MAVICFEVSTCVGQTLTNQCEKSYLRDSGDHIGMFHSGHTKGRKPTGYLKLDMNDPEQLKLAILLSQ